MKEKIYTMINDEIKEIELVAKEEYCEELFKLLNKLIKLSKKPDKKSICEMSNSEILLITLGCANLDIHTWEEIKKDVHEIKEVVDNWTYDTTDKHFEKLYIDGANEIEVPPVADLDAFSELGLTPNFTTYRMNTIYTVMSRFLEFKEKIANDSTYVSNQTKVVIKKVTAPMNCSTNTSTMPFGFPLFDPKNYQVTSAKKTMSKQEIHEEIYRDTQMNGVILAYDQYYKKSQEYEAEKKTVRTRKINLYEKIKRMLNDNSITKLTDIPNEWEELLKTDILIEIYMLVHDNLRLEYQEQEQIKKDIDKKLNKSPIIRYLYSKGIDPNGIDAKILEELESKKIEDITTILDFLIKIGLNIIDLFTKKIQLIYAIDSKKIPLLNFLVDSKILSKTTIINNPNILTNDITKLQANYEILKPIMDFNNTYYDDRILIIDPKELKDRLSVLKEYRLTKNNYMYLLCNYDMIYIYDLMLENEIPLNLFISICKTSNPLNTIKRIIIYKTLDIPYENNFSMKKDVTDESKFICTDEDLDMYIGSVIPYLIQKPYEGTTITDIINDDLVKKLDELYLNTSDTYRFGNTIISRPKVLRILEANQNIKEDLFRMLISSSIFNEKNIYEIQNALQEKKLLM